VAVAQQLVIFIHRIAARSRLIILCVIDRTPMTCHVSVCICDCGHRPGAVSLRGPLEQTADTDGEAKTKDLRDPGISHVWKIPATDTDKLKCGYATRAPSRKLEASQRRLYRHQTCPAYHVPTIPTGVIMCNRFDPGSQPEIHGPWPMARLSIVLDFRS
jgi:hypothetical protein